ncbi:MAG: M16 family metallopeptidase, partial [Pseudobdellovibrionaceae bacterium]
TEKSIDSMKKMDVVSYYNEIYAPENFIFSASGCVDHQDLEKQIEKYFAKADLKKRFKQNPSMNSGKRFRAEVGPPEWKLIRQVLERPTEQVQIVLGFPVPTFRDHHRFESFILNAYLGGGMTSSLFQSVREKTGLVYNIQSSLNTHKDCGCLMIYASTEAKNVKKVVSLISAELNKVKRNGISKEFIRRLKTQICGQILLGSDDVENRMSSLGINEMVFGEYRPVERVIEEINNVTQKTMDDFIKTKMNLDEISGVLVGSGFNKMKGWWKNAF